MAALERLHSLNIDMDKGIYEVNGKDISESGKALRLEFDGSALSLIITEDTIYSSQLKPKE